MCQFKAIARGAGLFKGSQTDLVTKLGMAVTIVSLSAGCMRPYRRHRQDYFKAIRMDLKAAQSHVTTCCCGLWVCLSLSATSVNLHHRPMWLVRFGSQPTWLCIIRAHAAVV